MEAALKAIAEPHRREILRLVWNRERPAGEIAAEFDVSHAAISQHLRVLKEAGLVTERRDALSGQAWESNRIILSWEDVAETAATPGSGYNLVLHEFAHYLDAEGRGLAAPAPGRGRSLEEWSAELGTEFDRLREAVDRGEETFLDPYAAEDEAEFFAVATEEFLDRAADFRAEHPGLYGLLREFYGLDPAAWAVPHQAGG